MTSVTLNIEDCLSEEEKRNICFDAFFSEAKKKARDDFERILSNSAYSVVWEAVNNAIDKKAEKIIEEKTLKIIKDLSSYSVFKKKDAWEKEDSYAYAAMQKTIRDNMHIVEEQTKIKMADVSERYIQENLQDMVCETITKLVQGVK